MNEAVQILYNGQVCDVAAGATVADLLVQSDRPLKQIAVEVNRELVPRSRHAEHRLQPGDQVEIVTLAGGG
jgi:sulfur carrier protein